MIAMPDISETMAFFTQQELSILDKSRLPRHVAFIPDGNRRWAKHQQAQVKEGHRQGGDTLIEVVKAGKELGIKIMTFYLFSTENWLRPEEEVQALMWLLDTFLIDQRPIMIEDGIRLQTIGDLNDLPKNVQQTISETKTLTAACSSIEMIFALNYGSRGEICKAVRLIAEDLERGNIRKEEINESLFSRYLDSAPHGDPDLWIRTSGEYRLSNFLLWQLSYAELYFTPILWPNFRPSHLLEALINFQSRERRWGGS
jgi:undecaprenyl diphosphate synthase